MVMNIDIFMVYKTRGFIYKQICVLNTTMTRDFLTSPVMRSCEYLNHHVISLVLSLVCINLIYSELFEIKIAIIIPFY